MMKNVSLRLAKADELQTVFHMYRSSVGREGCAWDDVYPGYREVEQDFAGQNLYVLVHGSHIMGAVSVVDPPELADEDIWYCQSYAEIARVVVDASVSGQGYASFMLLELFRILKEQGTASIRLSVSLGNPAALRLYQKLGFRFLKRKELYGGEYFLCEKILSSKIARQT